MPTAANPETNHEPVPAVVEKEKENIQPVLPSAAVRSDEASKRAAPSTTIPRPSAPSRASTIDTPAKALKVLGITGDVASQQFHSPNGTVQNTNARTMSPSDAIRQRKLSLEQTRPSIRPATAQSTRSSTPPLSLDYSYAQAVDALQSTEGDIRRREQQQALMKPSPLKTTYLDLVSADTPLRETSPTVSRKTSTKRRQDRWTLHHPDLPLDSERKKNRRKSTSDARLGREREVGEEPPVPRRDSVDIAVLAYLQNERLSRKLRHPQTGRVISFSEVGDPNGATVFVCLGMGLTRYVTAFYDELATTLRLRLITIDRPGVGGSEPYPANDRTGPLSWPDDVLAICQHLGIQSFSLLAHSAGAIYALASALILPHMIQGKVHLLAPWIPPSQLQAVSRSAENTPPAAALPRSQRFLRVLPTPFLKAANSSFMTATSASLKPNTKRNKTHAAKLETIHQNTVSDYPTARRPASSARPSTSTGDGAGGRPDFNRRESMMLM
ncbi:MAG: alpha/beta hydrolase, partial [Rhodospirillales bacterium]|nr:alpha/beta hydrolase [Acetobacter sp.]